MSDKDNQMRTFEDTMLVQNDAGDVMWHQHDQDGMFDDFIRDRRLSVEDCHWCQQGIPRSSVSYRYVVEAGKGIEQHVLLGVKRHEEGTPTPS